jgi:RNA recognition motif-containing protein
MNIFVGNLSHQVCETDLGAMFEAYGQVSSISLITDGYDDIRSRVFEDRDAVRRSRGYGYVEMPSREEAQTAVQALNGTLLLGRTLSVIEALPRGTN